jgi:hypothetical protein
MDRYSRRPKPVDPKLFGYASNDLARENPPSAGPAGQDVVAASVGFDLAGTQ